MVGGHSRFMTEEQRQAQSVEAQKLNDERLYICPNCGSQCFFMGLDFKAPRSADVKAWREVEAYIRAGKVYYRGNDPSAG